MAGVGWSGVRKALLMGSGARKGLGGGRANLGKQLGAELGRECGQKLSGENIGSLDKVSWRDSEGEHTGKDSIMGHEGGGGSSVGY